MPVEGERTTLPTSTNRTGSHQPNAEILYEEGERTERMKEIEVTAVLDAPFAEVERRLSPETIVEYAETYTVESVTGSGEKTVVTAVGEEIEIVLEFAERDAGYIYSQRDQEGPFEEMRTRITLEEIDEGTRVRVRSLFTFGGWAAFLTDWLGADVRRDELKRLLVNLARDFDAEES